jgi:hypothetical protein
MTTNEKILHKILANRIQQNEKSYTPKPNGIYTGRHVGSTFENQLIYFILSTG